MMKNTKKAEFPIKYLEENLVFNADTGAVYAYYEFDSYNYSLISEDKAMIFFRNMEQLIERSQVSSFHMLDVATEESIHDIIIRSKKDIQGVFQDMAYEYMDGIEEHLKKIYGDYIVKYRYYIGFQLSMNEYGLMKDNLLEDIKAGIRDFYNSLNRNVFGDYIRMDNAEVERYLQIERLLSHKISKYFHMRKAEPRDMAYIIRHINGEDIGAFDAYTYEPELIVQNDYTKIKTYDVIRIADCLVTNKKRYLDIVTEHSEKKVAYLALADITYENEFPFHSEVLFYQQEMFDFPVDTSIKVEVLSNKDALKSARSKKAELKDLDENAFDSGNESSENLVDARRDAHELEADLEKSKENMYKVSYLVRVSADTKEELVKRVAEVRDFYSSFHMILQSPLGDMPGFHEEFYPSTGRYLNDYIHYVKSDFLASLGFGADHKLGEPEGIYIGLNMKVKRPVFIKPWSAAQGVKGTVTNALAKAFVGSLGGGKSVGVNLISFYSVLFGGKAFVIDPKGERGNWEKDFEFLGKHLNMVRVSTDEKNKGLADPFSILPNREDAYALALDVLTFLTGCHVRDGDRFATLSEHVEKVARYPEGSPCGMLHVIEELDKTNTEVSRSLARHIKSFTKLGVAGLLFGDGQTENSLQMDEMMNVILVENLVLPEKDKPFEKYTMVEFLSIAVLLVFSTFALEFIKQNREIFKVVVLDEAWSWLQVAEGKTLSDKLVRAGRAMNAAIDFVTQNCDDFSDEKMKNNIGAKFVFRSRDKAEIRKALEFVDLEQTDSNMKLLSSLENGECLHVDNYGYSGKIYMDVVYEHLFRAWDTRPPMEKEETGNRTG